MLADRGLLDYDTPIAYYWPEFASGGKDKATIRHALTHRVGIPNDPPGIDIEMMINWNAVCQATAEMKPLWEPGTKISYHPLTYGWILGEVISRIDGRSISQFLQDEVCQPLGIENMYFGVPPEKEHLVSYELLRKSWELNNKFKLKGKLKNDSHPSKSLSSW